MGAVQRTEDAGLSPERPSPFCPHGRDAKAPLRGETQGRLGVWTGVPTGGGRKAATIISGLPACGSACRYQPRRALTVTMPRVASRVSASRTMVRLQSNSMASCSPRREPGASFCAITASMMRLLISVAVVLGGGGHCLRYRRFRVNWYTS